MFASRNGAKTGTERLGRRAVDAPVQRFTVADPAAVFLILVYFDKIVSRKVGELVFG